MDPADLVRRCRVEAGLTQQQLAVRAGTTKTAISRLEGGHLSPTFETLQRLLACMGYHLTLDAVPMTPRTDVTQLEVYAGLTPSQRLDHALTSQAALDGLVGAARGS
ncbi:MAG: helix-turn-helix transcriptional regulator [Nitriliruptor sp.]